MTADNDDRIRVFLADEARRAVAAAPSLNEAVGRLAPRVGGRPAGASRRLIVLLAATLLVAAALGTAIAVGSGLLRLPVVINDSEFLGAWASTNYNDYVGGDSSYSQTMTIRAGEDGVLHIEVRDDSSLACSDTPTTMTGVGRLEDATTLVVTSPVLACADGGSIRQDVGVLRELNGINDFTLMHDLATDRLYDNLGGLWNRGAPPIRRANNSTEAGVDGAGTFAILHGEVTFRAAAPWNDHSEAYIDPRVFFLLGPGDESARGGETAVGMTILVNPLPADTPCESLRVPPSAADLVGIIRSNPDLEATVPVTERLGGLDALRMDVVAATGASIGPCSASDVDVVTVPGRPWGGVQLDGQGRLYVLDLPGGSARTLAILITASEPNLFERAVEAAAPVLDSLEFQAP